ncbi:hypothetical protein CYLTODRAFT_416248 [Cylindrobasidium torrendii FP15055 ss-10]|uniref:Ribonuclease H2 subunit B n=1 Tax=Cylindrobasidium torrendii FP15055 ss-10 TaxID=1314674 RepID=A0A0D7BXN0_9AGAR|nr:hypothetical protein CYLTODRAFT_416248 [Cylindrobasidium torrendii FP15055 ss-10]
MPKSFAVLPEGLLQAIEASNDSTLRLVRLLHPRTDVPALFQISGENGGTILELQAVAPPSQRSWILDQEIISDGKMLILTPVDPAFLVIPLLQLIPAGRNTNFRGADDLFEDFTTRLKDLEATDDDMCEAYTTLFGMTCMETALKMLCETKELDAELTVYRYSSTRIIQYLRTKVAHICRSSQNSDMSRSITRKFATEGLFEEGYEEVLAVARTRMSCEFVAHYLAPQTEKELLSTYNFKELDVHMDHLAADEAARIAATTTTKKGKKSEASTEDKKRKAPKGSKGVDQLKKANTKGMSKISSFFQKK